MISKSYKRAAVVYTVLFALIFTAAYAGFFLSGRTFVTKVDGIDQYYTGFLYFGKYMRSLSLSLYDLSIGMGEDILGSLNYYGFADPVYLIAVFAKGSVAPYIYSLSFFIRIFLAGLAFLIYCRQMGSKSAAALAGVFCFIVNGFVYGGVTSYMGWGSVLIYLPLMLTGVERIFKGQKKGELIILSASVYAALCGFYFLYMTCVFLILYCLGRGIAIYGMKNLSQVIRCSLTAAIALILGILLAAPVFFPSVMGFLGSERANISIFDIIFDKANWTPYLSVYRSFINQPEHYYFKYFAKITPVQYAAVIAAFFLPRSKGKLQLCVANTVIMLVAALPITGYIFSGFGESGFEVNTRWAFLVHFIFAMTLVYVLDHFPVKKADAQRQRDVLALVALVLVLLFTCRTVFKNSSSGGGRLDAENISLNTDSPVVHSSVIAEDGDVFRVSLDRFMTTSDRPENIAMLHGYYGITYWLSIMNNYTQLASDTINGREQEWRSDGFGHDIYYETMYGVKYYLGKGENIPDEGYEAVESFDYHGETWTVYKNARWLSMAHAGSFDEAYDTGRSGIASLSYDNKKNLLRCTTTEDADSELVISLPYSSGWEARVDGKAAQTFVRDMMSIGLDTGGGAHEVELRYKSRGFTAGCMASVLALLVIAVYAAFKKEKRLWITER